MLKIITSMDNNTREDMLSVFMNRDHATQVSNGENLGYFEGIQKFNGMVVHALAVSLASGLRSRILETGAEYWKIPCIKFYRFLTGCSLMDAKHTIDALEPIEVYLFVAGRVLRATDIEEGDPWEIMGIFTDHKMAEELCYDRSCFVGPIILNKALPKEVVEWPDAYVPNHAKIGKDSCG